MQGAARRPVRLRTRTIAVLGLLLIAGQSVFSEVPRLFPQSVRPQIGWWWEFVYPSGLPLAERARGWLADVFITFGRVPMFFYLLHIRFIHILALGVNYVREGAMHHEWYATAPYANVPSDHQWNLGLLYAIFAVATVLLYAACRWFRDYKATHDAAWLRFI